MGIPLFVILIIVVAAGLVVGLGLGLGFFRIERLDPEKIQGTEEKYSELKPMSPLTVQDSKPDPDNDNTSNDYFAEEEPEEESLPPPVQKPVAAEDGVEHTYDKLCSFKTGRGFFVDCQKLLTAAAEQGQMYAMACFDFDRFRFLNSLRGQSIGDFALTRMSQEMREIFPEESMLTRMSADHFLALFPSSPDDGMLQNYAELLKRVSDRIREDMGIKSGLRVSVGFAFTNQRSDYDAMLLMQRANLARHCIKSSKESIWSTYDQSMVEGGLFGESALEDYKENQYGDDISLYFQPVVDLAKGQVTASDLLVRWSCDEENYKDVLLTPENARISTNNRKVVYQCCRWMGRWKKAGKAVPLTFVTLPATDFYKEDFDAFLAQCFHDFQNDASTLAVNVDHSVIRLDRDAACRQLKKFQDIDVKTAVSGIDRSYTSLEFLEGIPLDFVKLHSSIAEHVEKGHGRVEEMIASAGRLGLTTVFEGVNNQEQAAILKRLGAGMAQGRCAGIYTAPEDYGHGLSEYAAKQNSITNSTTILDDSALSKGDFKVY